MMITEVKIMPFLQPCSSYGGPISEGTACNCPLFHKDAYTD